MYHAAYSPLRLTSICLQTLFKLLQVRTKLCHVAMYVVCSMLSVDTSHVRLFSLHPVVSVNTVTVQHNLLPTPESKLEFSQYVDCFSCKISKQNSQFQYNLVQLNPGSIVDVHCLSSIIIIERSALLRSTSTECGLNNTVIQYFPETSSLGVFLRVRAKQDGRLLVKIRGFLYPRI